MLPLLVLVTLFSTAMTSTASSSHVTTGTTSASTSALRKDALVLASLKQGLLSPAPAMDSWDSATPACLWHGVKCDSGRVVAVDLSNLNISGTVSSEFSGLDHLVNLSLAGNQLEGHIKISNMISLRYLNISGNQFTGDIDWDYSGLPELVVFDAYDNNFTSGLPAGLVNSRKLRYLDLGGNFFFGEIPGIYGNFTEMEYLSLAGNDLRGRIPSELGKLRELKQLYLGYFNMFDGGIPAEMGSLSNLVHLDLSNCGLTGQIPRQLGDLKNLDTLFLHTNLLSGPIPAALGNLTGLIFLDLSNNALTGEIPPEFARLQGLTLLNLFMNRLHGSVPEFLARLPMLETLGLFMNNFTGVIPENLGDNGRIQVLDMSSNKLTGMIPVNLCASNQLRVLILLKNFLFGPIPEGLGRCSTLTRVRLGQNYLNGSVPPGFLYLPHLNLVELQSNYLAGMIAEDTDKGSRSSELEQLNLSDNLFTGTIPTSILKFSSLQTLQLTNNQFSGPIPAEIGLLRRAVKLDLSQNALSDVIPSEISNCSLLTYLDLSHNNLSGQIPQEISGLGILNYLNVSQNHLNGTVPRSIAGMKSLTAADFSFNDLSGKLPDTGQFTYFNASSFTGNPNLCGPVTNNPCNSTAIAFGPKKIQKDYKLVVALSLLICSLVFAVAVILRARSSKRAGSTEWKLTTFRKVQFTVSDVLECMNDSNVIGRGGAGVVYVGRLPSGDDIAVKRLLGLGHNGHDDHGFKAEIRTLGNIRHRNIVRLLAFCSNSETNLLVYEYMRNGSLGEVLHGKCGSFLGWDLRYRIALESARGLCYLHHDCNPIIVHRDVKSNNILLDSSFEAHVADFGLAKFLQDGGASECMSAIAGSYGYIAPEYAYTLKVDEKSDVYSYGVVLLELLTGRKPIGGFGDGVDIVQWTRTMTDTSREHVIRVLDNRLSTIPVEEAMHVFFVAMLCTQENSVERPTMREVVQMLSEFPRHLVDDRSPSSSMTPEKRPESPKKDNLKCYKLFPDILN